MDNGVLQLTISKPEGAITGIRYNGVDNLLETLNEESNRGYIYIYIYIFFGCNFHIPFIPKL